eukprot:CAMPEP_0194478030 /NCGR_PEP_ID=MMETSP0253-20130528/1637_1 /TAXON_ID=2966 /ORGANISM="Noctiluca scintillans" /LENGTH=182 /DNA_ID=CAMNT_0039317085 /DNA_START=1210 /DNA_END=1756 /DNA_ORIENTATION=-
MFGRRFPCALLNYVRRHRGTNDICVALRFHATVTDHWTSPNVTLCSDEVPGLGDLFALGVVGHSLVTLVWGDSVALSDNVSDCVSEAASTVDCASAVLTASAVDCLSDWTSLLLTPAAEVVSPVWWSATLLTTMLEDGDPQGLDAAAETVTVSATPASRDSPTFVTTMLEEGGPHGLNAGAE